MAADDRFGHPPTRLLVYSDEHLRDRLCLEDGDRVALVVSGRILKHPALLHRTVFALRRLKCMIIRHFKRIFG